jgi:hypothetical protein
VQPNVDQMLLAEAASSLPLPPDARLAGVSTMPSRDTLLPASSALDRCVLLARLIL